MTPETTEAVRKALEAIDSMIDHAEGTQRAPMCVKVGISHFVNEILAILDAESEDHALDESEALTTAHECGYARGLEHAASLIDASIYVKSENANMAKQIRALLPNAVKPK